MSDLERELAGLPISWPDADVRSGVSHRLREPVRSPRAKPWIWVAVSLMLGIALLVGTPGGRSAVANILEVAGIEIGWGQPPQSGSELSLGRPTSIEEVAGQVDFDVLVADPQPDAVYISDLGVHMVWSDGPELPSSDEVSTLFSQFPNDELFGAVKTLPPTTDIEFVSVREVDAVWITGSPHALDLGGEPTRLAANVLAWEEEGIVLRVETSGSFEEVMRLVEGLRDLNP